VSAASPRPHRVLRALARVLAGLLLLVFLGGAGLILCLGHLEWGPCRQAVQSWTLRATGLAVDYERLSLGLSGTLEARNLTVRNPPPWDAHAPNLLRIGRVEARLRMASLARGAPEIEEVRVEGVDLALVQDEEGRGSLDAVGGAQAAEPASGPGMSGALDSLDLGVTVRSLRVSGVSLARVRATREGDSIDRLEGLVLEGAWAVAEDGPRGSLRVASDPESGLVLTRIAPDGSRQGVTLRGLVEVAVERGRVTIPRAEWVLAGQDLDPRVPREVPILQATARADLDSGAGKTRLTFQGEVLGALTLEGEVEVADERPGGAMPWEVRQFRARLDSDRIPEWLWPLVPGLEVRAAILALEAGGLGRTGDGMWRLPDRLSLQGTAARLAWMPQQGTPVEAEDLAWSGHALPGSPEGPALAVEVTGRRLAVRPAGTAAEVTGWSLSGRLEHLLRDMTVEGLEGDLHLAADGARAKTAAGTLEAQGVSLSVQGRGGGTGPSRGRGEAASRRLRWAPRQGHALDPGPVRLSFEADEVLPARPVEALSGRIRADLESSWLRAGLDAEARGGTARLALDLACPSLDFAAPWLPQGLPLSRMAATARVAADLSDLDSLSPEVRGSLSLFVDRPATPGEAITAARAGLEGRFHGRLPALEADGTLTLTSPRVQGHRLADSVEVSVRAASRPGLLRGDLEFRAVQGGRTLANAGTRIEAAGALLNLEGRGTLSGGPLWGALLPADVERVLDGARLAAEGTWKARFTGVTRVAPGEALLSLAPDALRRARGSADLDLGLRDLRLRGRLAGSLEGVRVAGHVEAGDDGWKGRLGLDVGDASLRTDSGGAKVQGLGVQVRLSRGPDDSLVAVDLEARVREATAEAARAWPMGDLTLSLQGRLVPFSVLRLDRLSLDNPAGGTRLEVQAAIDDARAGEGRDTRIPVVLGRRSLSLEGTLTQDLSRLGLDPEVFRGRGVVEVPFRVESGDWSLFRIAGAVQARGVDADLPGASLRLEGLDGVVSVFEEVALGEGGRLVLVGGEEPNEVSRMRFPDVQPFLARGAYVTFRLLRAGPVALGPGAGNLRIAGRSVSLDQMEADWHGGKVTGQWILDYRPGDTLMRFRGSVTGVRPGGDEAPEARLDAHAALVVSLERMEAEGRAQVLRIDRGHLRRALDALDPAWENVAMNRVRKYLAYGYPREVRVRMERGFLSAGIDLGGIASVVRIDEIRGIPTGPLLRRLLGSQAFRNGGGNE